MVNCGEVTAVIDYDNDKFTAKLMEDVKTKKTLENAGKKCEQEASTMVVEEKKDESQSVDQAQPQLSPEEVIRQGYSKGQQGDDVKGGKKSRTRKRKRGGRKSKRRSSKKARKSRKSKRRRGKKSKHRRRRK